MESLNDGLSWSEQPSTSVERIRLRLDQNISETPSTFKLRGFVRVVVQSQNAMESQTPWNRNRRDVKTDN